MVRGLEMLPGWMSPRFLPPMPPPSERHVCDGRTAEREEAKACSTRHPIFFHAPAVSIKEATRAVKRAMLP